MVDRATKLRWRRRFRRSQKHVENIGVQAEQGLEEHFFRRLNRFVSVRRFVFGWILLFALLSTGVVLQARALSRYYTTLQPVPGGVFTEGVVGSFTNANPLYATGSADAAVSKLVFSGLMKYNEKNQLVGDLAEKVESDDRAVIFTVTLRPNLKWHDGRDVTAEDIVFTYKTIQNPDAKSPLRSNWVNVKIEAKDPRVVVFTLPHGLASFPHSLTTGIVPKHLLDNIPASQLRSVAFNTVNPVGAGPFKWGAVEVQGTTPTDREERVGLVANTMYHLGEPKLSRFIIRAFRDEARLTESFKNKELTAVAGLNTIPDGISNDPTVHEFNIPLTGEVMVFFRNSQDILKEKKVRQALVRATDRNEIIRGLGYPVIAAKGPFLQSHIGYNKNFVQLEASKQEAKNILEADGWKEGPDGIRVKDGKLLSFRLYSQSNSQYAFVSQALQRQWREIGVDVQVILQQETDLQSTISFHNFDALLYGISLGTDPDVFAYWHSSQADPRSANRLNFSEYNSKLADQALEGGRSRLDRGLREVKYLSFLDAWREDAPAIALYQPRFLYLSDEVIHNFNPTTINSPVDRYANVHNWMIREQRKAD
jgi:peptide/nickel transport system substrate-binding protein